MTAKGIIRVALLTLCLGIASIVQADARTDFLIRMLQTSEQFRVRAQAALALGGQKPEAPTLSALSKALRDVHPAVRAASAAALERLRDPTVLPALRAVQGDKDGSVRTAVRNAIATLEPLAKSGTSIEPTPTGPPIYYVGVGLPGSQIGLSPTTLKNLRAQVTTQVAQIQGVKIAPENEERKAADRVISGQKLVGFYLDSSVTSIEQKPDGGIRAQVSVIVGTYPGRDMRAMLSGAATVTGGGTGEDAKLQAIQAAFTSALRKLPQAMQAGVARAP